MDYYDWFPFQKSRKALKDKKKLARSTKKKTSEIEEKEVQQFQISDGFSLQSGPWSKNLERIIGNIPTRLFLYRSYSEWSFLLNNEKSLDASFSENFTSETQYYCTSPIRMIKTNQ